MNPPTDSELQEITILEAAIRPMLRRLDELKLKCKEHGSFCTKNYVCTVSIQVSQRIASLDECKATLGMDVLEVNDLVRIVTSRIVKVTEKPSNLDFA